MKAYRNLTLQLGLASIPCSVAPVETREKGKLVCATHGTRIRRPTVCDDCPGGKCEETAYELDGHRTDPPRQDNDPLVTLHRYVKDVDPVYLEQPYLLWGGEQLGAIASLLEKGGALIGEATIGKRRPVVIRWSPTVDGLVMYTCRHYTSLRGAPAQERPKRGLIGQAKLMAEALDGPGLPDIHDPRLAVVTELKPKARRRKAA